MTASEMKKLNMVNVPLESVNLIEASAGTGKTYTIANLYLRFVLEQKFRVNDLLVVTFTEAATKELRDRLRVVLDEAYRLLDNRKLCQALEGDNHITTILQNYERSNPDQLEAAKKRLRLAVVNFDESAIFTIHGFCQRMLNENAFESNLPFDLELVADDSKIRQQLVHDFWRKLVFRDAPIIQALLKSRDLEILNELAKQVTSQPDLITSSKPSTQTVDSHLLISQINECWHSEKTKIVECLIAKSNKLSRGAGLYKQETVEADAAEIERMDKDKLPLDYLLKYAASTLDEAITGAQKKKGVRAIPHPFFDLCEQLKSLVISTRLAIKHELITFIKDKFRARKSGLNIQSFDDILLNLRKALRQDPGGRFHHLIQSKFKAVMIDEFQDTDPVQYEIFKRVFLSDASHPVFLIGDPKQSIYQFRGADIFAYLKAKKRVNKCWTLDTNYRSEAGMIQAINHLFIQQKDLVMSEIKPFLESGIPYQFVQAGGLAEKKGRLLIDGKKTASPLELLYLTKDIDSKNATYNADSGRLAATETVARKIVELVNMGKDGLADFLAENGEATSLQASDIAVLVKGHKEARQIQQRLLSYGVPSVLQSSGNVLETAEAEQMFCFLAAVVEPGEFTLRPFLLTPFVGKDVISLKDLSDDELQQWYQVMLEMQRIWLQHGFISMFRTFMIQKKVRERILATENGERTITNILHLAELIHKQAISQKMAIDATLTWFNEKISHLEELPEYEVHLERDADAVRIITVHSSKGLEFKIVFCPFEWSRKYIPWWLNKADSVQFYNRTTDQWELDIYKGGPEWDDHLHGVYHETLAENLRLLYVALTRARNQAYLVTGDLKNSQLSALSYLLLGSKFSRIEEFLECMNTAKKDQQAALAGQMKIAMTSLCSSSQNCIGLTAVAESDIKAPFQERYTDTDSTAENLNPEHFEGCVSSDWGIGSFSWLTKNISHGHKQAEPVKEREETEDDVAAVVEDPGESKVLLLPKGARTGSAVHEMLEEIDFVSQENLLLIIQSKLRKYGVAHPKQDNFADVAAHTADMIENVLATLIPQADSLVLNTVPQSRRITELEFFFPIANISPESLAMAFRKHGKDVNQDLFAGQVDRLTFHLRNGFMGGFVDLVFEHKEKFYILDWKTNWLGASSDDYSPEAVNGAMVDSYYFLQYHLYTVAVHLYLKNKLSQYAYATHFGGAIYTFVRGMTPDKPGHAVFFDHPSEELILDLCRALGLEEST